MIEIFIPNENNILVCIFFHFKNYFYKFPGVESLVKKLVLGILKCIDKHSERPYQNFLPSLYKRSNFTTPSLALGTAIDEIFPISFALIEV